MIDTRLSLLPADVEPLLQGGRLMVFNPPARAQLPGVVPVQTSIVQPFKPDHDAFASRGFDARPEAVDMGGHNAALVVLPRAKDEARALIALAAHVDGPLFIDGQKTDGVESILKAVRARQEVAGVISKAHGKLFWLTAPDASAFADWSVGPALTSGGFWTAPGVFSADGIDPASALLADALPEDLHGRVADLGAGWGFLSAHILVREGVTHLDIVEAHHMALACAEHNVTDERAQFHWADATKWQASGPLDAVVMNPPFHTERTPDPTLGQAFVKTAARLLSPRGTLWMVANRHLPYEEVLTAHFAKTVDLGGDARFKLILAERPKGARRAA